MVLIVAIKLGSDINYIVSQMKLTGMVVQQCLSGIGVVIGDAPSEIIPKLEAIPGVLSVKPDQPFQLNPIGTPN
jgi:hypothetical protein